MRLPVLRNTLIVTTLSALPVLAQGPDAPATRQSAADVQWVDFDADGRRDLVSVGRGKDLQLLRNHGEGQLVDITVRSGLGGIADASQALFADYDADGHQDVLVVVPEGSSRLFRGSSAGIFTAVGPETGLHTRGIESAEWLDVDDDGRVDLQMQVAGELRLARNTGGAFESVALPALDPTPAGYSVAGPWFAYAHAIRDANLPNEQLTASSVPTLGKLMPLSQDFFIAAATGSVGIGTTNPTMPLDVNGPIRCRSGGIEFPDGTVQTTAALTGPRGPAGPQGPQGAEGLQGQMGPAGPQGPAGNDGPQGPAGPRGAQGPQGAQGAQGPQGSQGPQGPAGKGYTGTQYYVTGAGNFQAVADNQVARFAVNSPNGGYSFLVGGTSAMVAPVHLPTGARIEAIRLRGYDTIASTNIKVSLVAKRHTSSATTTLAEFTTNNGSPGFFDVQANFLHSVDHQTYSYYLRAELIGGGWHSAGLLAAGPATIEYIFP